MQKKNGTREECCDNNTSNVTTQINYKTEHINMTLMLKRACTLTTRK